jgi:hypothetical protein
MNGGSIRVGTVDQLASGECGCGRDNGVKSRGS